MCDNDSNRTDINNSKYDDDPSYSSQNVGYSGQLQQRDSHTQNLQQSSNQYDVNSSELAGDSPPSQTTQPPQQQQYSSSGPPVDNRTNGGGSDMSGGSKRLHVSNIPFRFRENDLHAVFAVSLYSI